MRYMQASKFSGSQTVQYVPCRAASDDNQILNCIPFVYFTCICLCIVRNMHAKPCSAGTHS